MARIYNQDEITLADGCLCLLPRHSSVLEIGSATGYATRYMTQKMDCTVTCIEKIPEMAEKCRQYAKNVIIADLETDDWELELKEKFDVIMFADVLEHLLHPDQVLARTIPFLKNGGCFVTSIPNIGHNAIIMSLRNGHFNYQEIGLLDNTHIHFFTHEGIDELFAKNNFYCIAEEDKLIRPCDTEFEQYYLKNAWIALSLIHKPDAHVYRYVQKWMPMAEKQHSKPMRFNLLQQCFELCYDTACFCKRHLKMQTPKWFTNYVHKPMMKKDTQRYAKYATKD